VTNEEVVFVDQSSLFHIKIRQMNLDNVASVSAESQFWNIFPFGKIHFDLKEGVGSSLTLLEHIIQLISLHNFGLSVSGNVELPLFTSVYYFAKSKGAAEKGAFEHLLSQMSSIEPGPQTLILADEIEAVTEPGVAGTIVCASADYFLRKGCFMIIATHLGKEIQKRLPLGARIDGIEAGYISIEYFPDHIVAHELVLLPEFQGKGIGSKLLKEVLEEAKIKHIPVQLRVLKKILLRIYIEDLDLRILGRMKHIFIWRLNPLRTVLSPENTNKNFLLGTFPAFSLYS
jgi:GNAT superfamily N-acetyltransferase